MSKEDEAIEATVEGMKDEAEVISDLINSDPETGIRIAQEWLGKLSRILPAEHDGIVNVRSALAAAVANPDTKKEYADLLKKLLEVMNKKLM